MMTSASIDLDAPSGTWKRWLVVGIGVVVAFMLAAGGFLAVALGAIAASAAAGCGPAAAASGSDGSSSMMANAKIIYGAFAAWGMPNENIAGILGNWEQESGLDPTRVQRTENTPYVVSDAEQAGAEDTDNGIGLGQWTFGRNTNLRAYAAGLGASWGSLEIQLGFMLSPAEGGNADIVREMIASSKGSPQAAAAFFHDEWERSADTSTATREANAARWMGLISGWEPDEALGQRILAQSGATVPTPGVAAAGGCKGTITGEMALPLDPGFQMTSDYGPRVIDVPNGSSWHAAIDLQHWPDPCGDPVYAILPGKVVLSSALWLSIEHMDGFVVSYLHMYQSDRVVDVGDQVVAGQKIGLVGNVPPSGGCHLDLRINVANNTNPKVAQLITAKNETRIPPTPDSWNYDFVNPEEFMRLWGVEVCPPDSCRRLE